MAYIGYNSNSIYENEIIDNNNVKGSSTITVKDGQYLIIAGKGKVTATKQV